MQIYPHTIDEPYEYPTRKDFFVSEAGEERGFGLFTQRPFQKGEQMARFTGEVLDEVKLHTLQINPTKHLYDPYFVGYLLHSCAPNVLLDMESLTMWAIEDIASGEALTMDYTSTEDILYRQFPCACQAEECRRWITGQVEAINDEGRIYLKKFQETAQNRQVCSHG